MAKQKCTHIWEPYPGAVITSRGGTIRCRNCGRTRFTPRALERIQVDDNPYRFAEANYEKQRAKGKQRGLRKWWLD